MTLSCALTSTSRGTWLWVSGASMRSQQCRPSTGTSRWKSQKTIRTQRYMWGSSTREKMSRTRLPCGGRKRSWMKSRSKKALNLTQTKCKLRFFINFVLDFSLTVRADRYGMETKLRTSFSRKGRSWNLANLVTTLESAYRRSHRRRQPNRKHSKRWKKRRKTLLGSIKTLIKTYWHRRELRLQRT